MRSSKYPGIPLQDPYSIKKNFTFHRKNFLAIKHRKPVESPLPPQPKHRSLPHRLLLKPFLNLNSRILHLKYSYNPHIPLSHLRIYNQNHAMAARLFRIHDKSIDRPQTHQHSWTNLRSSLHQQKLDSENQSLAKRLIVAKSQQIDQQKFKKHETSHKNYRRLRSMDKSIIDFGPISHKPKKGPLYLGEGSACLRISLRYVKLRHLHPSQKDLFQLWVKHLRDKPALTQLLTHQDLQTRQVYLSHRKRSKRLGPSKVKVRLDHVKENNEVECIGSFSIELNEVAGQPQLYKLMRRGLDQGEVEVVACRILKPQ